jgi:PAS domain S-box-containing protein
LGCLSLGIYWAARRGRYLFLPLFLMILATLDGLWFINAGSMGPMGMIFLIAALYLVLFFTGRARWTLFGLLLANGTALLLLERRFPGWVVPNQNPSMRTLDFFIGYVITTGICVLILWLVLSSHQREEQRLEEARKASQESQKNFSAIFQLSPDGMYVMTRDSGRFLEVNESFEHVIGYSRDEILGKTSLELELWPDPSQRERLVRELATQGRVRNFEAHIRSKSGQPHWIEISHESLDLNGKPCLLAIARDITERKRAEDRIHESEARYRAVFEQAGDYVLINEIRPDGPPVIVDVNDAALKVHGYTREELVGQPLTLIDPFMNPAENQQRTESLKRGSQTLFEVRHRRKDGSTFDAEVRATPLRIGGRELILAVERDITERKHAEAVLRISGERLRLAMQATQQGWFDLNLKTGEVVASQELARIIGDETLESPMTYQTWVDSIHQDDRSAVLQRFSECLKTGETKHMEYRMLTRTGEWKWVGSSSKVVASDAAGLPARMIGTHVDITERRQTEKALRDSEAKLQEAAEMAKLGYWEVDHRSGRVIWSEGLYRMHGRSAAMEPPTWEEFQSGLHPEDRAAVIQAYERHLKGHHADQVPRYRIVLPAGEVRHIRSHWQTEYSEGGTPLRTFGTDQDETEQVLLEADRKIAAEGRLALEAQLQHLQRMESVGRLAGGISHDMNNVLAAIMAVSELLLLKGGEHTRQIGQILEATQRGRNLLKGLMAFARKEVEDAEFFDLNELVRKEAELLSSTTLQRIKLELALAPRLHRIMGSATALSTALMNLCVNAVDAMPDGGTLTLRTARLDDQTVELVVQDTGHGMPPEVISRAMEPFYTTKPKGKGTGLGLSLVFGTVQAHGGSLDIRSQVGKGTEICIHFPVIPGEGHLPAPATSRPASKESGVLRVLLVDDDPLVQQTAPGLLESDGHHVTVAGGGYEALGLLEHGSGWDVVVLDLNMPELDGYETLKRLRHLKPDLPVIVATGYADDHARSRLEEMGHVSILPKPYSIQEFRQALAV